MCIAAALFIIKRYSDSFGLCLGGGKACPSAMRISQLLRSNRKGLSRISQLLRSNRKGVVRHIDSANYRPCALAHVQSAVGEEVVAAAMVVLPRALVRAHECSWRR